MIIDSVNKNKSTRGARAFTELRRRMVELALGAGLREGFTGWRYNPLVIRRVYRRMTAAF